MSGDVQLADLAAELAGVTQPAEAEQPAEVEEPETAEAEVADPEEETPAADDAAAEEADGEAVEDTEEPSLETITELADAIGWEPDEIYSMRVPMGNGREPMTVGELKDQVSSLETERAQIEQQRKALAEKELETVAPPEELLTARAQALALQMQFNSVNWAEIEQQDPGRAALMKQDMATQYQAARDMEAQAMAEVEQRQMKQRQEFLAEQTNILLKKIPDWNDPSVREREQAAIVEWGEEHGLDRNGLENLMDANIVSFLREMWKKTSQLENAQAEVKKVRKAPKPLRGRRKAESTPNASKREAQIIKQARKPGLRRQERDELAVALLRNAGVK